MHQLLINITRAIISKEDIVAYYSNNKRNFLLVKKTIIFSYTVYEEHGAAVL
jgi:hypothetical protein